MVKLLGVDSGKHRDAFAIVAIEIRDNNVLIKNAKRWIGRNYLEVEQEVADIHRQAGYNHIIVELNNTGTHVYEVLKYKHQLPVIGVTTSKDVKDLKKSGKVMDKNDMVRVMLQWFKEERLIFPKQSNPELNELKRQLSIFAEHKTEAGNISYYAEGSEHDDLVMALMLGCWKARSYLTEKKRVYTVVTKRHEYGGDSIGSGVPQHVRDIQSLGVDVYYPR